jgi:hypothetical protein
LRRDGGQLVDIVAAHLKAHPAARQHTASSLAARGSLICTRGIDGVARGARLSGSGRRERRRYNLLTVFELLFATMLDVYLSVFWTMT